MESCRAGTQPIRMEETFHWMTMLQYEDTSEDKRITKMLIEDTYSLNTPIQNIIVSFKLLKSPRLQVT